MMSFDMYNKKAPTLELFPKEQLMFVALGCLERKKTTSPLTTAPWPGVFFQLKNNVLRIGSQVKLKHLFCLRLFATPCKPGGFSLPC